MFKLSKWFFMLLIVSIVSCEDGTTTQNSNAPVSPNSDTLSGQTDRPDTDNTNPVPVSQPACDLPGTVLDENLFWAKNENLLVSILATEETTDPDLGESHRVLEVYDRECNQIFRNILPVNVSPDFPYYLSDITYNNVSRVVAIRGFNKIYIFDLVEKQLSEPMTPSYLNERYAEDAQSGMIQRLELWEDYLVGYATGEGTFVFDISDPMAAKSILPAAELTIEAGTDFHSLFFLQSKGGAHQAILPTFDPNTGDFAIDPLFEKPINIETNINRNFRNNRFLVLKELLGGNEKKPIGVDMLTMKKYDIPAAMASKKDTEIIAWMKQQE